MKTRFMLSSVLLVGALTVTRADDVPPELAWVPTNCSGFIHVRFHDLWSGPAGKSVLNAASAIEPKMLDQIEQTLGVPLARIDRITILLPEVDPHAKQPGFVVRITTTRPYDRRDVMSALRIKAGDPDARPRMTANLIPLAGQGMLHFDDDKNFTLLPNEEGAVALLGRMLSQKTGGGQTAALKAAAGKSHIVASIDLTQVPRIPAEAIPPELRGLRPLIDAKTAILTANVGDETSELELRFTFGGKDDAAECKHALDESMKPLDEFLSQAEKDLGKFPKDNAFQLALIKEIKSGLKSGKVQQHDSAVAVELRVNSATTLAQLAVSGAETLRVGSYRTASQNNLKQIGLAFHNYVSAYNELPMPAIYDKNGRPLLSWRVAILPFIEEDNLYKQFRLDEPWDSEHNIKLIKNMPKTYMLPGDKAKPEHPSTYYQVFVGPSAAFEAKKKIPFPAGFPDGTSNTIWLAEGADPVPWSKPDDIVYDQAKMPKIGFHWKGTCNVGFADGSVRAIKKSLDEKIWHFLIQRDDGNIIPNLDD